MREQITQIVNAHNPKSYARIFKSKPDLYGEVMHGASVENFSEALFLYLRGITPPICSMGNRIPFDSFTKGYRTYCSLGCECRKVEQSRKMKEHHKANPEQLSAMAIAREKKAAEYGVTNIMQSSEFLSELKERNLTEYGYSFPIASPTVKEKIVTTNKAKYGVERPLQSKEIRTKARAVAREKYGKEPIDLAREALMKSIGAVSIFQTPDGQSLAKAGMISNHGVAHPQQVGHIRAKTKETLESRYGRSNPAQLHLSDTQYELLNNEELFKEVVKDKTYLWLEENHGLSEKIVRSYCDLYGCRDLLDSRGRSKHEADILQFLETLGVVVIANTRSVIPPKELDFYIPEYKLAIELNGVYWHSELSGGKGRNYHLDKVNACDAHGIQLLSIYDIEWESHKEILSSKIKSLVGKGERGCGARKLTVVKIDSQLANLFLTKYHIQGHAHYSNYHIGAFDGPDLAAVMSVRAGKESEITRFASSAHHPGVYSKMLKMIPGKVFTFADRRMSKGDMYIKSGGKEEYRIPPDYQYTKSYRTLEHKTNYRKEKIERKFNISLEGKTEWEAMQELGYDRIWDCGKIKYSWCNPEGNTLFQ